MEYVFQLRNPTDRDVKVESVLKSCGCIAVNIQDGAIVPSKGTLDVEVKVSVDTLSGQEITSTVIVKTNSTDSRIKDVHLTLKGSVKGRISVDPGVLNLKYGQPKRLTLASREPDLLKSFSVVESSFGVLEVKKVEGAADRLVFEVQSIGRSELATRDSLVFRFKDPSFPTLIVPARVSN